MMRNVLLLLCLGILMAVDSPAAGRGTKREYPKRLAPVYPKMPKGKYKPDPESTKTYPTPEWLLDAKLGIYTHWGPDTFGEEHSKSHIGWYGRTLYIQKGNGRSPAFDFHKKHFGDQNEYGLKDLCMDFKAEKFDADEWADLFEKTGARFAGTVSVHHNNFLMWDSKISRWNSKLCGPKRDIMGELEKAIRKRGMKFIATFHHGATWNYNRYAQKFDGKDPQFSDLYTDPHEAKDNSNKNFNERFQGMVDEVILKYEPDLIWFDFGFRNNVWEEYRNRVFADYYNWADSKGKKVGVIHKHWDLFNAGNGIIDGEKRSFKRIAAFPWVVDNSIHSGWFWHDTRQMHSVNETKLSNLR